MTLARDSRGPIGLVAGKGLIPLRIADAATKSGRGVACVLIEGFADPAEFARYDPVVVQIGQVGRLLDTFRRRGARDLVMAGRVTRPSLLSLRLDGEGLRLVGRIGRAALFGGDDGLLSAILRVVREEGFNPISPTDVLGDMLVEEGLLTTRGPDEIARADIARGIVVTRKLGEADVGQGCVVQQGLVLAMEGIEGTDAMLARCGALRREGPGGVLVKLVKPQQARQIDLPTIGPDTVRHAAAAGLAGIAIEARADHSGTLVVDRAETVALAEAAGLFILAIRPDAYLARERIEP